MTKNDIITSYYKDNYKHLINIARRRVGNYCLASAEDAVQEAFSRACRYFRTYNREESFDKWFKAILYNAINQIKNEERDKGVVNYEDVEEQTVAVKEPIYSQEVNEIIANASERDRHILNMYFFYGFKSREISELLSMSHDVVRDVIRRFRFKLRP